MASNGGILNDATITEIAAEARRAYRDGARPSAVIRAVAASLRPRGIAGSSILLIMIGRAAFGLSISECKHVGIWWRGDPDDLPNDAVDDYLTPLIERNRSTWDRR